MRVVTANLFRKNEHKAADRDLLLGLDADYIGTQEDWLAAGLDRYRVTTGRSTEPKHAREVAGYLHERHPMRGEAVLQVSDGTGEDIREHARWLTVTFTRVDGVRVAFINTHLAAGQFDDGRMAEDAGGQEYRDHARALSRTATWVEDLGYTPVVTMDSNDLHGIAFWSPKRALGRRGLRYVQDGLDGIAFDPEVWRQSDRRVVDPVGADHDWLVLDLEPRS